MIKLIGMDFDGTLLNDSKEVTKKTKDTLRAARDLNRNSYGFEIDRNYYKRAKEEMLAETDKQLVFNGMT